VVTIVIDVPEHIVAAFGIIDSLTTEGTGHQREGARHAARRRHGAY
jgi:hypothetical protein